MQIYVFYCTGPFFITTNFDNNEDNIYFKVEECNVHATTEESEASRFYVRYEPDNSDCPLQLQYTDGDISYLAIKVSEQKSQSSDSEAVELVSPERWFQEETFYISCSTKPETTSGNYSYFCIHERLDVTEDKPLTSLVV
jgi:hypothetical protein